MKVSSSDLRSSFLQYFKKHDHHIEKSAPLIPKEDPTLLFVNAGMVPFKNVFTKKEAKPYKTIASSQKCVRAGGKHNDLENVGKTTRHHTFFEMLGNFSFGDYFKEKAITLAWDFLVKELKLNKERLSVSIFAGDEQVPADDEAFDIWHSKIGLKESKIKRLSRADNFWQMGDTGPCGPCSEIYYDKSDINPGFGTNDADEKNIEIWNLVFMQYEQKESGLLIPLPSPSIDTGMGLERLTSVINGLRSNYDTDLLRPLIAVAEEISQKKYTSSDSQEDVALRVIADHSRATSFLIADGLFPGNESRSYVLRRIMRRAIRYGSVLQISEPFFHKVCLTVCTEMGAAYPELRDARNIIEKIVYQEEESFRKTLSRGLLLFESKVKALNPKEKLPGKDVFHLYETFGFPPDLTMNLASERGIGIDFESFEIAKREHEEKSSADLGLKGIADIYLNLEKRFVKTEFLDEKEPIKVKVLAILSDESEISHAQKNSLVSLVFDKTPFYGESGGQIGDTGILNSDSFEAIVIDTKKILGLHIHKIKVINGILKVGDILDAQVDWSRRQAIRRNHSATHLLHAALRQYLGTHVIQKGSLVAEDRLRFDFSHFESLKIEDLKAIEKMVNTWILDNEKVSIREMSPDEAKKEGALALFGEKYGNSVRVLNIGFHSIELCGGTHVKSTGDIGLFKIIEEGPLALGIRRIEAITGFSIIDLCSENESLLKETAKKIDSSAKEIPNKIELILNQLKEANKVIKSINTESSKDLAKKLTQKAFDIDDIKVIIEEVKSVDKNELRTIADMVSDHFINSIVVLGIEDNENKALLIAKISPQISQKYDAGKLINEISQIIGGKGGGKPSFAQAGGPNANKLKLALELAKQTIENIK